MLGAAVGFTLVPVLLPWRRSPLLILLMPGALGSVWGVLGQRRRRWVRLCWAGLLCALVRWGGTGALVGRQGVCLDFLGVAAPSARLGQPGCAWVRGGMWICRGEGFPRSAGGFCHLLDAKN